MASQPASQPDSSQGTHIYNQVLPAYGAGVWLLAATRRALAAGTIVLYMVGQSKAHATGRSGIIIFQIY
ncbi:hypothetical protein F4802DRAFT_603940 [Xylaria palmicola]|nr:hypothetical protein F4802DRAFT_603940 [Xylaria palmicola]